MLVIEICYNMVSEKMFSPAAGRSLTSTLNISRAGTSLKLMLALVKLNLYLSLMDKLEPPQQFLFEGNVSHTWRLWLKQFHFYLTATEKGNKYN